MSRLRATEPVRVSLGACQCPDSPHEEDEAWLVPELDARDYVEGLTILREAASHDEAYGSLTPIFLRGLDSWNLLDDQGKPIPARASLVDWETQKPIVDAAFERYAERMMRPLAETTPTSSDSGRTDV